MKELIIVVILSSLLSACIVQFGGETYLPVEQAALKNESMEMRAAIELIEPLLATQGYESDGIYLERANAKEINRRYDGPSHSSVSLRAKDGCISFVAYVEKDTHEYAAPRRMFNHVIDQLSHDGSWDIKYDQVCLRAP